MGVSLGWGGESGSPGDQDSLPLEEEGAAASRQISPNYLALEGGKNNQLLLPYLGRLLQTWTSEGAFNHDGSLFFGVNFEVEKAIACSLR